MTTPPVLPRIGTAQTPGATRVMLLGSGELGKEVTIAFQRLGVEVIAVDRYYGAPAQQVAHRSYTINMANPDELLPLIREERPDYVIPEIEALATDARAYPGGGYVHGYPHSTGSAAHNEPRGYPPARRGRIRASNIPLPVRIVAGRDERGYPECGYAVRCEAYYVVVGAWANGGTPR